MTGTRTALLKDRLQRALEERLIRWYTDRTAGSEPERRYEVAERLARHAHPEYWFSEYGRIWLQDHDLLRWYENEDPSNRHSADRKYTLRELAGLVQHVDGAIAECGVYRGASSELLGRALPDRHLHLFDSFEGLSQPEPVDGTYWSSGDLTVQEDGVRTRLDAAGLRYTVHKGWIPEKFPAVADDQFAIVHIDVDLYRPTLDSLAFFYPRTASGGLIVMDDYGFEWCPGARRAADEYMSARPERIIKLSTGQAFIQRL